MTTRIAFVNGKGGVGKTTCATLIAAALKEAGQTVSIQDLDPQGSATTAASIFELSIGEAEPIVIMDTAPNIDSPGTLHAISSANLVILVTTPSPLDLATTATTAKRIGDERAGGLTRVLFNLVQTNNRFFQEMPQIAKEIPFPAFKTFIPRLTTYQVAQISGWKSVPARHRENIIHVAIEIMKELQFIQEEVNHI
jgi:chromosome partitioning protein